MPDASGEIKTRGSFGAMGTGGKKPFYYVVLKPYLTSLGIQKAHVDHGRPLIRCDFNILEKVTKPSPQSLLPSAHYG
jgi:hypothetical protein